MKHQRKKKCGLPKGSPRWSTDCVFAFPNQVTHAGRQLGDFDSPANDAFGNVFQVHGLSKLSHDFPVVLAHEVAVIGVEFETRRCTEDVTPRAYASSR